MRPIRRPARVAALSWRTDPHGDAVWRDLSRRDGRRVCVVVSESGAAVPVDGDGQALTTEAWEHGEAVAWVEVAWWAADGLHWTAVGRAWFGRAGRALIRHRIAQCRGQP
jgi:hypothetical protein